MTNIKPSNGKLPVIKSEDVERFIADFNKNKVTNEYLEKCKRAGQLFDNKRL